MTPTEMIAEWRRGCSNAPPEAPEQCPVCTRALVEAIEHYLDAVNRLMPQEVKL